jgi:hypothetical protein
MISVEIWFDYSLVNLDDRKLDYLLKTFVEVGWRLAELVLVLLGNSDAVVNCLLEK